MGFSALSSWMRHQLCFLLSCLIFDAAHVLISGAARSRELAAARRTLPVLEVVRRGGGTRPPEQREPYRADGAGQNDPKKQPAGAQTLPTEGLSRGITGKNELSLTPSGGLKGVCRLP